MSESQMRRARNWILGMGSAIGVFASLGLPVASARVATPPPTYEIYALRYATLLAYPTSEFIPHADTGRRTDAAMMVWLIKGPDKRTILVDAGFYRDEFVRKTKLEGYRKPSVALEAFGISPDSVTDIIISHVHWDHLDGVDLFPRARIWIQRAEYEYYVGPNGEALHRDITPVDAKMLARLRAAGRVNLVEGDNQEIIPGIRVFTGGRHTYASQYATVSTRAGTVVIASDNVYLYENLDSHVAIGTTFDSTSNLAAQDRMRTLASSKRYIIPGHDPAVFLRFPVVQKDVVRIN